MASRHDSSSQSSRRLAGRSIGQFIIDKEIGKGSFAQVYMGWHKVRFNPTPVPSRLLLPFSSSRNGEITLHRSQIHEIFVVLGGHPRCYSSP